MNRLIADHSMLFLLVLVLICGVRSTEIGCPYSIYPHFRVNLAEVRFETFDAWIDGMCAQCYNYLGPEDNAWNEDSLRKYLMEYMYVKFPTKQHSDTTSVCFYDNSTAKVREQCFDFKYKYLNNSEDNVFISQLNGKRYVVCIDRFNIWLIVSATQQTWVT